MTAALLLGVCLLPFAQSPASAQAATTARAIAATRSASAVLAGATASVIGHAGTVAALTDARSRLATSTGAAWQASSTGTQRIRLQWSQNVRISSLQIYGSPGASGAATSGRAVFSNGSTVDLLPVAAYGAAPTTIAFAPRSVKSMTLELTPRAAQLLQLREIAVFANGTQAPVSQQQGGLATTSKQASSCATSSASSTSALRLVCPRTGERLRRSAHIVIAGPNGAQVHATAVLASGKVAEIASGTVSDGVVRLGFDATVLPGGPVVIRLQAKGVKRPLNAQLINPTRAVKTPGASEQAAGRSLVYDEEFNTPLSISSSGVGAKYAATKPASWGNSEFGDAVFANPATNPQNLTEVDQNYLRIRTTPLAAGERDPAGWGRHSRGGILSSASVPGGGFAAQYGYFEARMLAPASPGTWPAFWLMSSSFLKNSQTAANGEVDAVELYGQDSTYSCHSWHNWLGVATQRGGRADCVKALPDWALTWHTYGVKISPTGIKYYIDGALVSSGPKLRNASDPYYFMLNLSLGGGWPINLTGVNGVADLYVDYVRVYV